MCQKRNSVNVVLRGRKVRVDSCLREGLIEVNRGFVTVASCCGHNRYPETIVAEINGEYYELNHEIKLPRKRRFYRRDRKGYYFIPEISNVYNLHQTRNDRLEDGKIDFGRLTDALANDKYGIAKHFARAMRKANMILNRRRGVGSKTKVSDQYKFLIEISCKACKLDCNNCMYCEEVEQFVTCDLVPQTCALRHNIIYERSKGG